MLNFLAIDIGASSGRHIVGTYNGSEITTTEVYRFKNGVEEQNGHLIWNIQLLLENIIEGIKQAFKQFPDIKSLSVDTWGVDYVLLKDNEEVLPCYAYRDTRTEKAINEVHSLMPFGELYKRTGCQFQPFTTVYQLYDDKLNGRLEGVTDFLMLPEYFMYKLTGVKAKEFTEATTTGLINAQSGKFDTEIIKTLGFNTALFGETKSSGYILGDLLPEVQLKVGGNCKVVFCATHDTGSAVEGIPMVGNQPYISSGTWSLLGVKTNKPITTKESEKANYSNEGGVGYNRYQKNIMGMWLINRLKDELCPELSFTEIVKAAKISSCEITVDANDEAFLSPKSMKEAFDCKTNNSLKTVGDYFCCAYTSLAKSYKTALEELEANTKMKFDKLYIVGGGAKNEFLNKLTEKHTGKQVIALPIEATALGNLKSQTEADL